MSKVDNLTDYLTDLGNTIRAKKSKTGAINPQDFSDEISSIDTAKPEQAKIVTYTTNGTFAVTPDEGYTLAGVRTTVNVPGKEEEEKTASYTDNGTYTISPSTGKTISKATVTVDVPKQKEEETKTVRYTSNGTRTVTPTTGKVLSKVMVTVDVPQQIYSQLFAPVLTKDVYDPIIFISDPNGDFTQEYKIDIDDSVTESSTSKTINLTDYSIAYGGHEVKIVAIPKSGYTLRESNAPGIEIQYYKWGLVPSDVNIDTPELYNASGASLNEKAMFFGGLNGSSHILGGNWYTDEFTMHPIDAGGIGGNTAAASSNKYVYAICGTASDTQYTNVVYMINDDVAILRTYSPYPSRMGFATACSYSDDAVMVSGGKSGSTYLKTRVLINDDGTVTDQSNLPEAVAELMSGRVGDYSIVAGGYGSNGYSKAAIAVSSTGTVTTLPTLDFARRLGGCARAGNNLLIVGGFASDGASKDIDIYNSDLTKVSTSETLNSIRYDIGASTFRDIAVFAGGFMDESEGIYIEKAGVNTVDYFDTDLTHEEERLQNYIGGVACAATKTKLYTYGGCSGSMYYNYSVVWELG